MDETAELQSQPDKAEQASLSRSCCCGEAAASENVNMLAQAHARGQDVHAPDPSLLAWVMGRLCAHLGAQHLVGQSTTGQCSIAQQAT